MIQSTEKQTIILTFCLLQPYAPDQSECTNVSHIKVQFLAEENLRSTLYFYIYIVICKAFEDFMRINILSTVDYNSPRLANILT